jgi:hypothetical protein
VALDSSFQTFGRLSLADVRYGDVLPDRASQCITGLSLVSTQPVADVGEDQWSLAASQDIEFSADSRQGGIRHKGKILAHLKNPERSCITPRNRFVCFHP